MTRPATRANLLLEQKLGISQLFDLLIFCGEFALRNLRSCGCSLKVATERRFLNSIPLAHAFQVLFVFPCKFFIAFHQLDVFTFQSLILFLERIVLVLELLIGRAELGKVLMSAFKMV